MVTRSHSPSDHISPVLLLAGLLWICSAAQADTSVAWTTLEPSSGYTTSRLYAGRAVAARASELGFRHGGQVSRIEVDVGDRVQAGEMMAALDTASIAALIEQAEADVGLASANLMALEAETQLARQTEARFRSLRETGHVSEQVYDEQRLTLRAKTAQLNVAMANVLRAKAGRRAVEVTLIEARIHAPFAGVVQARYLDEGSQVVPGQRVLRLVETGRTEAHVGVPEIVAAEIRPGGDYRVIWERKEFTAHLKALLPEVDPSSRTLTAVFDLAESPIPPGAVVEFRLEASVAASGYWLPMTALTEGDRGLWGVFVVDADSLVERRLVEIIHTEAERAYVRGTLSAGDRVVSTGVQRIVPGQRVALVEGT